MIMMKFFSVSVISKEKHILKTLIFIPIISFVIDFLSSEIFQKTCKQLTLDDFLNSKFLQSSLVFVKSSIAYLNSVTVFEF